MLASIGTISSTKANFIPTDIAGLKFWIRANTLSLSDNDPVTTWPDESGNGNDVSQSTAGFKPVFKTNILNGLPIVRFDGIDDTLTGGFTITYGSVFAVANFNSGGNFPNYNGLVITNAGATSGDYIIAGDGSGTTNLYNNNQTTLYVRKDLTYNFSPLTSFKTISVIDASPNSRTTLNIGNDPGAGSRFWNGDVAEIIIYDSELTTTQRKRVENYFINKYAL
jgi:hypothetical protein